MSRKTFTPVHPLAMADALTEINRRIGTVIMTVEAARSLSDGAGADTMRLLLGRILAATDDLRAAVWADDE